ncbi:Ig-like domain-containing protein [Sphingomonadaceae bacterium OTU29MARTA1]|nr:Ig-like domain-containing protein [Sphingomonadaceae bacterium OTU29MARTA1]
MNVEVISKATGAVVQVAADAIDLDAPSIVRLDLARAEVAGFERQGQDLVIRLVTGEQVRIADFYPDGGAAAPNDLVLRESDGTLWHARIGTGAPRFTTLADLDDLLAAGGDGGGSSLAVPAMLLGGLAAAGAVAAVAGGGGGDDDRGDDDDDVGGPPDPGNGSGNTAPDRDAPAAPTAAVRGDGVQVSGRGEPGTSVDVRNGAGIVVGSGVVGPDGTYAVTLEPPQTNGEPLVVTLTDAAGNVSAGTPAIAPDITAPATPGAAIDPTGATVTGRGEAGATVTIRDGSGAVIGTAVVAADGTYTATLSPAQANGGSLSVVQADAAGNVSPAVTLAAPDITAPAAPSAAIDAAGVAVTGRGEAGATVTIRDGSGAVIGTAVVADDGTYTATLSPAQANGGSLSVVQADAAGNVSPAVTLAAPDVTAPVVPSAAIDAAGVAVTGRGEAGATVTIRDGSGAVIGTAVVAADGTYTATLSPTQANGGSLSVVQADAAGNVSPAVTLAAPDITAPAAPSAAIDATGVAVTGRGEAGATVTIRDGSGAVIGTAVVAVDGTYTATLSPTQANGGSLSVVQADTAGNVSPAATLAAPDITAPAAPSAAIDATGTTVTGRGEAGATVTIRDASGVVVGSAVVTAEGGYVVALSPPQANGGTLTIGQTDPAGNDSPGITIAAPDVTAPGAPVATLDATGTIVSGLGEPGARVVVRDAGGADIGSATVGPQGSYTIVLATPQVNSQALGVTQVDAAGNVSAATPITAPDLTAPPAPVATVSADGTSVSGTGEAGATITVRDPLAAVIGTAVVGADGTYVVTLSTARTDGELLSVRQVDAAGNASPVVTVAAPDLIVDTAPDAPTAAVAADGGAVTGTADAGARVTLYNGDGIVVGTGVAGADGSYSVALIPPRIDGETIRVTQTDADGDISPPTVAVAPDLTAPQAPSATVDAGGVVVTGTAEAGATVIVRTADGTAIGTVTVNPQGDYAVILNPVQANGGTIAVTQSDAAGNVSAPTSVAAPDITAPSAPVANVGADGSVVTGTGEPGATVTVRDGSGTTIGSGVIGADGSFAVPVAPAQANGGTVAVTQTDAAGNVSPATAAAAPDITAPAAPTAIVSANGSAVSGIGEAGATVTVADAGGGVIGTAVVASDGSYTVALTPARANGEALTASQADAAGNVSPTIALTAPDITAPAAPTVSVNANGTVVTGTGEPGARVTITDPDGTRIGSATVAADGRYSATLSPAQVDGERLEARQADSAGNVSGAASTVAPDLTAPAQPTATIAADGASVGGTGEPGAHIVVTNAAGTVIGTADVASDGRYTAPLSPAQANGETLAVVQTDAAGNASAPLSLVAPDITAPPAPVAGLDATGAIVSGTGEPGARVTVTDTTGNALGSAIVTAQGGYTITLATPQVDRQTLAVVQTDAAGNASPAASLVAPDLTAPAAPAAIVGADGTTVSGAGEPGATVTIRNPLGVVIGSATVAADGSYVAPLTPPQTDGEVLSVRQADAAGNVSPTTSTVAPDLVADSDPDAPTAVVGADGASVNGAGIAGATITVYDATGVVIATGIADANGNYSVVLAPARVDGEVVRVTQTEADGDVSPPATAIAPDLTAPAAPTAALDGTGGVVTGTGEPGATITVRGVGGIALGTATVAANGAYAAVLTPAQTNGEALAVTQADAAGNVSPPIALVAPDFTAPAAPTASVAADGTSVTGNGEPNARIVITDAAGAVVGLAVVATDGRYVASLDPAQRNGERLNATQTDGGGNVSPPVEAVAPDLTAPVAPTLSIAADGASASGTGEPGATVTLRNPDGGIIGTVPVGADGSFTIALAPPRLNGETLSATQSDAAGNLSPPTFDAALDTTAPAAPTAAIGVDGATVTGVGEAGATVTVTGPGGAPLGSAIVAADGSYAVTLATAQGNGESLLVSQSDSSGNTSPATPLVAPDFTAPGLPNAVVAADGTSVTGTGEPGATVTITGAGGVSIGSAIVAPDGTFVVPLTPPQTNGEQLGASQRDATGNASGIAQIAAPDTTAPLAPTASVSADGGLVTGRGEPGATVTVSGGNGASLGNAVVDASGNYAVPLSQAQLDGQTLTVTQADRAGNVSPPANPVAPDTTAPLAPTAAVTADGGAVVGAGVTGATITVTGTSGIVLSTAIVGAGGTYSATLDVPQRNGEVLTVVQSDAAGNVSPPIPAIAPDLTAPAAPTAVVDGTGGVVTGIGEPGATVTITTAAGAVLGTGVVASGGGYQVVLDVPQRNGESVVATQRDPAGNASGGTIAAAPDLTAPPPPTALAVTGDGTTLTGTGEPGARVEVRGANSVLLGSGTVTADGGFTVTLAPAQAAGGTLSVTQADGAGNVSGPANIAAPFDIRAFDNSDTASIDLVPVTTPVNLGRADYVALVSLGLVNLQAQVLAVDNVRFSVAEGHTLDARFTYDALADIGVASNYAVVVQRLEGTQWVAVSGNGPASLLDIGLLNGNLSATETLGPGQYRAFLTYQGAAGIGLLGNLTVTGVDSDFTDIASATPAATVGNVIVDAGPNGEVDVVSPGTRVTSVTVNGVTSTVSAGGSVVDGAWGTLTINPDGSYSYTPDASAAAIGQTDVFTYTLLDPSDGEVESANLSITIGSPDVTGSPVANADVAAVDVTFANVVTTAPVTQAFTFTSQPGGLLQPSTGLGTGSFVVAPDALADITITAVRQPNLSISLLPSYTLSVFDGAGGLVLRQTIPSLAGLPIGTGATFTIDDLPSGSYTYTVGSSAALGTFTTAVSLGSTTTFLDDYTLATRETATGNLFDNDVANTPFAAIRVNAGGGFTEVGDTPVALVGQHGTLTVDETGGYVYQPSATLGYSATDFLDTFTYQLVQPNGVLATATLSVTIDVPADGAAIVSSASSSTIPADALAVEADVIPLDALTPVAVEAHPGTPDAGATVAATYDLFEGRGEVEDVLSHYLGTQGRVETTDPAETVRPVMAFDAPMPAVADPLDYLVTTPEQYRDETASNHVV